MRIELADSLIVELDEAAPCRLIKKSSEIVGKLICRFPERFKDQKLFIIRQIELSQEHLNGTYSLSITVYIREEYDKDADMEFEEVDICWNSELGEVARNYLLVAMKNALNLK